LIVIESANNQNKTNKIKKNQPSGFFYILACIYI